MKYLSSILFLFISVSFINAQGTQLLRQPTLSSDYVVFVYANDLWRASIDGGDAIRLTSNEGYESSPHFSNDGQWVAFSAQYGGNTDVYIIPINGGEPERLTWHPSADIVQGWTPDNEILFRSGRESRPTQTNTFYTVNTNGDFPEKFGVPRAAYGEVSPDGKQVAYTPITGWDEEWRNYRGGQAMPIWIVNLKSNQLTRTPQTDGERHLAPTWVDKTVFYMSERDYASNIWKYDTKSGEESQVTFHKKFDVKSIDAHQDNIIYEQGGYLHLHKTKTNETEQLNINVRGDMNFARDRWEDVSAGGLSNPTISPNGVRAAFEYRGDIFTFPKEKGSWRNLTQSSGDADRSPAWAPNGETISWFSDTSGEYELIIADQYGEQKRTIPIPSNTFYFQPVWSPDSKYLAYTDTDYNILVTNAETGVTEIVESDLFAHPNRQMNPTWSPDSKWITYVKLLPTQFKAVHALNVETKEKIQVTNDLVDAITPVFDQSGEMIYFLGSTNYGLTTGWLDMSSYENEPTRTLYAAILKADGISPNLEESDDEEQSDQDEMEAKGDETETEETTEDDEETSVKIDKQGLQKRIVTLNMKSGNFVGLLKSGENTVLVQEISDAGSSFKKYSVEDAEANDFIESANFAETNFDGSQVLFLSNGTWQLSSTDSPPGKDFKLNINAEMKVNPKEEYEQIFKEGWRFMRDFLYVDNVHGAPWDDVYDWYSPWISDVRHRTDLNYVVDILSGEVAVGHSYVSGGDFPDIDFVPTGLLGADFVIENDKYKISKIFTGESWNPDVRAPLAQPGLGVKEGDYIRTINGQSVNTSENIYSYLANTNNRVIDIGFSSTSNGEIKTINVKPVSSERNLRTLDWIESNRKKVDDLSQGRLAYVYVPNTGGGGFESFNRMYFSQQDKQGVIVDERNNGGGSAADYMIDIMNREVFGYFNSRSEGNYPWTTPMAGIWGPKVMIINERAGSGGDLLPYMFRAAEIGPLVGTKTWGGLVGTWDTPLFIDGGRMVAPRGGFFGADGNWAVEGVGVSPDIEVIQDPKKVINGQDPQLEAAVQEALRLIPSEALERKSEPAAPVRWKRPDGYEKE